jgi:hypothetical protein
VVTKGYASKKCPQIIVTLSTFYSSTAVFLWEKEVAVES